MNKPEKKFIEKTRHRVWATWDHFSMIQENDVVIVGVSGGKDSMVLLDILATRRKIYKMPFRIVAVHINVNSVPYELDKDYFIDFCENLEVEYQLFNVDVDFSLNTGKGHCFACSWHRRKRLFDYSKEINANKISLGHHRNDAIETLFMNMFYHGSVSSMPPTLSMFSGRVQLIRPLLFLQEKDVQKYSDLLEFKLIEKKCPYEDDTNRKFIKDLLKQIDSHNSMALTNTFYSTAKIFDEYIIKEKFKLK